MEKVTPNGFIIDIAPLVRLPFGRQQFFSYLWEKELPAGTLVTIPLFRRSVRGIVLNSRQDFHRLGNIQLKKILEVLEEGFLTQNQLKLAKLVSDYYLCSLGITLKSFAPQRIKARNVIETENQQAKKIILTNPQKKALSEIVAKKSPSQSFLLFGPANSGKTEIYIQAILQLKKQDPTRQFLILLPEITLAPQAIERYGEHFKSNELVVLHSKIAKGQYYSSWKKIKSGEAKIIIGSRLAVFAPFHNLGLIIIDEEQDMSFKQWDMDPRYDARIVAKMISNLTKTRLISGSATPSIKTFFEALEGERRLVTIPHFQESRTNIEIVDLRKERWKKNFSVLSKKLVAEIGFALKYEMQTIIFINRRGMSSFSVCAKCKNVLKCPRCEKALVFKRDGQYECLHCNYDTGAFAACSKCQSMEFKNIGAGTQKIEREIQAIFPAARIKRVDFDSMKKSSAQEQLFSDMKNKKIDILIGTQMVTKGLDLPDVGLIGIISADSLLEIADFETDEKAFQNIVQVSGRTGRTGSKISGKVILQTYNPENPIVKAAAEMDYRKFYDREIEFRKSIKYPPFSRLIKIWYQDMNKLKVEHACNSVFKEFSESMPDLLISEPQEPILNHVRGKYRKQIVIRILNSDEKQITAVRTALTNLERGWIIDIDPISLI